jgi:hypothetical protein
MIDLSTSPVGALKRDALVDVQNCLWTPPGCSAAEQFKIRYVACHSANRAGLEGINHQAVLENVGPRESFSEFSAERQS